MELDREVGQDATDQKIVAGLVDQRPSLRVEAWACLLQLFDRQKDAREMRCIDRHNQAGTGQAAAKVRTELFPACRRISAAMAERLRGKSRRRQAAKAYRTLMELNGWSGNRLAKELGIEVPLIQQTKFVETDVSAFALAIRQAQPTHVIHHGYSYAVWPEMLPAVP